MTPNEMFAELFKPHGNGFLYYPHKRRGGKFVTASERDKLLADFERINSRWGRVVVLGLFLVTTLIVVRFDLTGSAYAVAIGALVLIVAAPILWFSLGAPAYLVRNREEVVPARSSAEVKAQIRRHVAGSNTWWRLILVLCIGGLMSIPYLFYPPSRLQAWFWFFIGSVIFVGALWQAILKFKNR